MLIMEKVVESHLTWFGHVTRRPIEVPVRRVDKMDGSPITKGRGKSRKTINETIKRVLNFNGLNIIMIYDRTL